MTVTRLYGRVVIPDALIKTASIGSAEIESQAVTATHIGDAAVGSAELADSAVVSAKVADAAVSSAKIADAAVGSSELADSAVVVGKIAAGVITTAKLNSTTGTYAIASTQTTVAHGLGAIPSTTVLTPIGNAVFWESAAADGTNLYLTASAAANVKFRVVA